MAGPRSPSDPVRIQLLHSLTAYISEGRAHQGKPIHARIMSHPAVEDAAHLEEVVGNSAKDLDAQGMLGEFFLTRFRLGESLVDLRRSITHYSVVHDIYPGVVPSVIREFMDEVEARMNRAEALMDRAAYPGGEAALDEAIDVLREITQLTIEGHPALPIPFARLAVALELRFRLTRQTQPDTQDLEDAFVAIDNAIDLSRPDDDDLLGRRAVRIRLLGTKYDHTDHVHLLDEATYTGHELLSNALPDDHPDLPTLCAEMAHLYTRRYDRTMALPDIDTAISHGRKALALFSDGPERHSIMDDVGVMLRRRGEHNGDTETLRKSVSLHREAQSGYNPDHVDVLMVQNNLARALLSLGEAMNVEVLVGEATDLLRLVVATGIARSHPETSGFQQNLALALNTRFRMTRDVSDMEEQVATLRQACAGLADRPGAARDVLSDYGGALRQLAELREETTLLDESVAIQRQAVAGHRIDDPAVARNHFSLALTLRKRYERANDHEDRTEAIELLRSLARLGTAPPWLRVRAARRWGELEAAAEHWPEAAAGLGLAVELLPRVVARNLHRGDQERHLMYEPGLVADAVAAAVHTRNIERAAVLFEQGRGILTTQTMDLRTDLSTLSEQNPDLATEFTRLRDALDLAGNSDHRHMWAQEWENLLLKIRDLDGFSDFLRPMTAVQLRAAASHGPIVMVNVSDYRSDAIVIQPHTIDGVRLPLATGESTRSEWLSFMVGLDVSTDADAEEEHLAKADRRVQQCLEWLWKAIVEPVLSHLGVTEPPSNGRLGRMWWLPSTLLNFLPLHAAGDHDEAGLMTTSAMDMIISSYTPTVRSLQRTRERKPADQTCRPLVLAMPETPGLNDLPGARLEAEHLRQELPDALILVNDQAKKERVLRILPEHEWVHFSGHGHSDRINPSESHLFLAGAEKLTMLEISERHVHGELAFLAACRTGQSGLALADEAVHLAGAFQLAGYRHVIAAMWPIADDIALVMSRSVYAIVSPANSSVEHSAAILHHAVRKIRDEHPDDPMLWASYIHLGP